MQLSAPSPQSVAAATEPCQARTTGLLAPSLRPTRRQHGRGGGATSLLPVSNGSASPLTSGLVHLRRASAGELRPGFGLGLGFGLCAFPLD
jgi:hypothetical protein